MSPVLLTRQGAADMLGITLSHWDYWVNDNRAPDPVIKKEGVAPRWRFADIAKFKEDLLYIGAIPVREEPVDWEKADRNLCVSRHECATYAGIGLSTWDKWVKAGIAPKPRRLEGYESFRPKWNVGEVMDALS